MYSHLPVTARLVFMVCDRTQEFGWCPSVCIQRSCISECVLRGPCQPGHVPQLVNLWQPGRSVDSERDLKIQERLLERERGGGGMESE